MAGQEDVYEIRVSKPYRITYTKSGATAILRKVGTHDILCKPQTTSSEISSKGSGEAVLLTFEKAKMLAKP